MNSESLDKIPRTEPVFLWGDFQNPWNRERIGVVGSEGQAGHMDGYSVRIIRPVPRELAEINNRWLNLEKDEGGVAYGLFLDLSTMELEALDAAMIGYDRSDVSVDMVTGDRYWAWTHFLRKGQ